MSDKFRLMMDSSAKTKEEIRQELQRMIELKAHPAPEIPAEPETPPELEIPPMPDIPPLPEIPPITEIPPAPEQPLDDITTAVRKKVQERINSIVREAMEDSGDSYGERIPPREPRDNIDYLNGENTIHPDEIAYPPSEPEYDADREIRGRITEMRKLSQRFYNGYMLRQCAEETLVKQGEYMKDVTDDFGRNCFCGIERPVYGALSTDQLRTYFTWRTLARKGVYNEVDKPYVILYCYELLNRIGVLSAVDAYNRLSDVWENCHGFCPALDMLMPRWLKDFRAYNQVGDDVQVCPAENIGNGSVSGDDEDILARRYSGKLEYLMKRSSYNLRGSIFYSDSSAKMLEGALEAVLMALDGYFTEKGITMFELICGKLRKDHSWSPFLGAYVDLDRMDGFHALRISQMEQYSLKRGQPCLEVFDPAPYRNFIGWVLKGTESVLRKRTGFRYGLSLNITPVLEDMMNRDKLFSAVNAPEFSVIVPKAAEKWCDEHGIFPPKKQKKRASYNYDEAPEAAASASRAPVDIDVSKLAKIRQEADETTRRLIVDEPETLPQEDITERVDEIMQDDFEEQTSGFADDYSEYNNAVELPQGNAEKFAELGDGWKEFAGSLSADDIALLGALLNGSADEFCRSRSVMPETQYDRINAAAMEFTGDILIENGAVIEDYVGETEKIITLAK